MNYSEMYNITVYYFKNESLKMNKFLTIEIKTNELRGFTFRNAIIFDRYVELCKRVIPLKY